MSTHLDSKDPAVRGRIERIGIIGAGAWGTTLALVAHRAGRQVTLGAHSSALASHLLTHRTHPTSLPGIVVPPSIEVTSDLGAAMEMSDAVIVAVPTQSLREAIAPYAAQLRSKTLVSAAKGLERVTLRRPTEVWRTFSTTTTLARCAHCRVQTWRRKWHWENRRPQSSPLR